MTQEAPSSVSSVVYGPKTGRMTVCSPVESKDCHHLSAETRPLTAQGKPCIATVSSVLDSPCDCCINIVDSHKLQTRTMR